jgi:type VI secretion system protein ImpH
VGAARGAKGTAVSADATLEAARLATQQGPHDPVGPGKRTSAHLAAIEARLRRVPTSFDFFQAVRMLERLRPGLSGVGEFVDPATEVVRFRVNPSIAFAPAEIESIELPEGGPATMTVNFFGLTGPAGVLPHSYSLLVQERLRARDGALSAFLDMFHHRMISLFYRAWQKNQVTVCHEKQKDDRLAEHLLDFVGLGIDAQHQGPTPLQRTLLLYAGLLGPQSRGPVALEQLIEDVFDIPAEVEQFIGGSYPLSVRDQCSIGEETGFSNQLGIGAVAGDEVWDQQTKVRIRIGPLDAKQYADFLPTGSAHELLRWLVRFFSRDAFDFEVQLIMARDDVAACVLDDDADVKPQPLGWSTWIRTAAFSHDPDETVLRL